MTFALVAVISLSYVAENGYESIEMVKFVDATND